MARAATAAATYKLRRGLGARPRSLLEVAERSWVLAPGVDEPAQLPFVPEGHLERILCGSPRQPSPHETRSMLSAHRHVARETRAYLLRDAVLADRSVYCGLHKEDLFRGPGRVAAIMEERTGELDHAVLATTYASARWFAHLLQDELPLQMLAHTLGTGIGPARPEYRHEPAWRSLLQVDRPATYGVLHARELIVIDDLGQNPDKRARYQRLRERLAHLPKGHERVYLRRGSADGELRALVNASEVEERLVREGFVIVDTAGESPDEIVRACAGASVVVSIDGSHAAPAYFLARAGACILFICPPRRVDVMMARMVGFFGMFGALFVGEPVADSETSFSLHPDELVRVIDEASAEARSAGQLAG